MKMKLLGDMPDKTIGSTEDRRTQCKKDIWVWVGWTSSRFKRSKMPHLNL